MKCYRSDDVTKNKKKIQKLSIDFNNDPDTWNDLHEVCIWRFKLLFKTMLTIAPTKTSNWCENIMVKMLNVAV